MTATIDFGLSLNHRAWAVLHMLSATCICDVDPKVGLDRTQEVAQTYSIQAAT